MKIFLSARVVLLLSLGFILSLDHFGQSNIIPVSNPKAEPVRVTSIEGITEYRLANGLQILLFPDQTKQNITVNIVYRVGSRHEGYGETGMAHLLEHLLFKGTPKHPNIPGEMTARGTVSNANTWFDRTSYFETFAASQENLEWALELEADRMVNSFIAKKDLDSEFSVVRNEFESRENNPSNVLSEKILATAYQWHNYGNTTIGARSDIENVKIENLQAFYRKYYQPDNATLIVAGKFDEAKTLDFIQKKFGAIPKPSRVLDETWTVEPVQDGERQVTLRRKGESPWVIAGYHLPPGSHPDFPALVIASRLLADSPSGRLYKSLIESKKATGTSSQVFMNKEPGYGFFAAQLSKDASVEKVRDVLTDTIEKFAETPPTNEEVERFKLVTVKGIETSFFEPNSIATALTEWIGRGDWRLIFLYRDRMKKVTPQDVQRVAAKYLIQSNRTLGLFIPTDDPVRAEVPRLSDKEILAMANEVKGGKEVSAGEVFEATLSNLESRVKTLQIGGLKTAYLPKENRGDAVIFGISLRIGDEIKLKNRLQTAILTGNLLMRGTLRKDRQQIKDEIVGLNAQSFTSVVASEVTIYVTTTRQNLPAALKLFAEILKEPSFPQEEFEQLKTQNIANLENQKNDPENLARRAMNAAFNKYPKGDVRYRGTIDEDIADLKAVTLEDIKKFHLELYGASGAQMAIVGDFEETEITPLLEQLFGSWNSKTPFKRISDQYFDIPAINKTIETPDKANAFFLARLNLKIRQDNPDFAALTLGNFILGGGFLNSRLATRIRQKDGISYNVGSGIAVSAFDENGSFVANAIYAPQNVQKLEAAFKEELQKVVTEGFSDEEISQAKQGWLLGRQRGRGQDLSIAANLINNLFTGRTFAFDLELEKRVESLTTQEVNAVMKKYLSPDKISVVKAGDFSKAK